MSDSVHFRGVDALTGQWGKAERVYGGCRNKLPFPTVAHISGKTDLGPKISLPPSDQQNPQLSSNVLYVTTTTISRKGDTTIGCYYGRMYAREPTGVRRNRG